MIRFEVSLWSMIVAVLVIASVWLIAKLVPVVLTLVAALMLVGSLGPMVTWLERHRVRRNFGIGIVFVGGIGIAGLLLFFTLPPLFSQAKSLIEHEPEIRGHVVEYLEQSNLTKILADQLRDVHYSELLKSVQGSMLAVTGRAFTAAAYAVAAIFLAMYMMVDRDRLRGAVFAVVPRQHHVRFSRVLLNLETIVGGYIRGQAVTCLAISAFILVLLLACGVPNALALAVFGGLVDVLPYIGAFLTMAPAVAAAYAVGPGTALTVFVCMFAYEEFESRILVPVVYGRALRLPSSAVFLSLLVGAALGGIVGALLALPIAAAVLMLIDELRVELPGETVQPEDIEIRRKDANEEREYKRLTESAPVEQASAIAVELSRERKVEEQAEAKDRKDGAGDAPERGDAKSSGP